MERDQALEMALGQIEKQYGKGAIMRLGEHGNVGVAAIPTGALALDIALGIGGLPRGRVVEIFGPESSGKSTLAMHVVAEAQRNGGVCAYIDAEHAMDPVYASAIGVNVDELLISQPDTGEQALEITDMLIRSGALDVVVIDSVAALVPRAEIEGEMGDTHVGLQARLMSQALRKLTANLNRSQHHLPLHQPAAGEDRRDVRLAGDHAGRPGAEVLLVGPPRHPPHRVDQGRRRDHRQPHPGEGGQEQGARRRSSRRSSTSCTARASAARARCSTSAWSSASSRSRAPGSPTRVSSSGRGVRTPRPFLSENLDMMLEISEKIRQEVGIDEVDVSEIDADITVGERRAGRRRELIRRRRVGAGSARPRSYTDRP